MALIKLGGLAQDVRGSLNGTTFSRNTGGAYVRTKVSPIQPVSTFSSAARAIFGSLAQRWSTVLTGSQREAWKAFSATHPFVNVFGDSITLSGIAMYQSVSRALYQAGIVGYDDPPATFSAPAVVDAIYAGTVGGGILTAFTQNTGVLDTLPTNYNVYIFATPPLPASVTPQKSDFRLLNGPTHTIATVTTSVLSAYNYRFGTPGVTVNSKIWFRTAILDTDTGALGVGFTNVATLS
jgi:hypothetical protein